VAKRSPISATAEHCYTSHYICQNSVQYKHWYFFAVTSSKNVHNIQHETAILKFSLDICQINAVCQNKDMFQTADVKWWPHYLPYQI